MGIYGAEATHEIVSQKSRANSAVRIRRDGRRYIRIVAFLRRNKVSGWRTS
jgi:hypothetical protein